MLERENVYACVLACLLACTYVNVHSLRSAHTLKKLQNTDDQHNNKIVLNERTRDERMNECVHGYVLICFSFDIERPQKVLLYNILVGTNDKHQNQDECHKRQTHSSLLHTSWPVNFNRASKICIIFIGSSAIEKKNCEYPNYLSKFTD